MASGREDSRQNHTGLMTLSEQQRGKQLRGKQHPKIQKEAETWSTRRRSLVPPVFLTVTTHLLPYH